MRIFGSWSELVSLVFRKNSQAVTLRPNQSTTYTASRDIQIPPGDADHVMVSATSTQTLTNKTIDGDDNTVQDLPVTALKTVLGDADEVILRDASGVPTSAKIVDVNVGAAAGINATKIGNGDVDNTELSKLNGLSGNITTDSNSQTLTNKTIDGDDNTIQDVGIASLKTVLADADKVIRRDASGVVVSGNSLPNSSAIVTTDSTSTLTNKTLQQDLIDDYIDLNEESSPATPASGKVRLYAKADGNLYQKDDAGTETSLAGGGGSSESVHTVSSANYTILDGDGYSTILVSTGASDRTITLPLLANNANRRIRIKKIDSGTGDVIIDGNGSETIEGSTSYTLRAENEAVTLQADESSTEWYKVADKQAAKSYIRRFGGNGLGSGSTYIRRFASNFSESAGTAITDGSNATDGSIFTINEDGIYAITWSDDRANGVNAQIGITKNDDTPNQPVTNVTVTNILVASNYGPVSGNNGFSLSWTGPLVAGDVIRAHADTSFTATADAQITFTIAQVVKY